MYVVKTTDPFGPALVELVNGYITDLKSRGLAPASIDRGYRFVLERIFLPWCADNEIAEPGQLSEAVLRGFTASLIDRPTAKGTPLSRHSARTYIRVVRLFLNWAEQQGEEVKAKPKLPKAGKRVRDVLSREEIDRLEASATSERDRLIIRVLGDCGLRLDELTKLRECDILRIQNKTFLRVQGKGDRDRRVPMPPKLLSRLRTYLQWKPGSELTNKPLFPASRRNLLGEYPALTTAGVAQVVEGVAMRARLGKRVHAHLFRHSWMTEMLRRGMNSVQLSLIAGASQQVIANHYEHLTLDDAHDAMIRALTAR